MADVDTMQYVLVITFFMHLFFAAGVYSAATGLRNRGEKLLFAPALVWALHTLVWGMFALLPYWLIHHSNLRASKQEQP